MAWGWRADDHIVNVLPLHHVHGIVAIQLSAAYMGATCEMLPRFDAAATWACLLREAPTSAPPPGEAAAAAVGAAAVTVFMAVPTVYARLVELYDKQAPEVQAAWSARLRRADSPLRLMVSGSAALPEPLALRWTQISGHTLLERYGMTEFAMAISNPLVGARKLNSIGRPLPGYEARIVPMDEDKAPGGGGGGGGGGGSGTAASAASSAGTAAGYDPAAFAGPGELQMRGPGVFREYWGKPEATAEVFTPDGWFKTGDCAERDEEGYYRAFPPPSPQPRQNPNAGAHSNRAWPAPHHIF